MSDLRIEAYERNARQVVAGLRRMADRIEQEAMPAQRPNFNRTGRFTAAASRVHHELTWGVANLAAYHLIETAHHADLAESERGGAR